MTDPLLVALSTAGLIMLSAFFVVIEFALLGARRHRLEELAPDSRSARAALRGMNDLTLMLAGAQLGITLCTFALGAITKPAVHAYLGPLFLALGAPDWMSETASFVLSLFVVTFLHLVVGEMAPKSWAIAHPEKSAMFVGLIAQAYIWPLRPLLGWINWIANSMVRAAGVEPVESAAVGGQDAATIRQLVEHSADVGALEDGLHRQISGLIDLGNMPVESLIASGRTVTSVAPDASVADVRAIASKTAHMRILVAGPGTPKVVHVRDILLKDDAVPAASAAHPAFILQSQTPIYEALASMRSASVQLAVVMNGGQVRGILTLADILKRILPASNTPVGRRAMPVNTLG